MKGAFKLLIPPSLEHVRLAGILANRVIAENFTSEVERYRLELAIVEALTNVVKHGYPYGDLGEIEVGISSDGQCLEFSIIDDGIPFNPCSDRIFHREADNLQDLPEGGMGIFLMKQGVDDLAYARRAGKNHLTMRKRLSPPEKTASAGV